MSQAAVPRLSIESLTVRQGRIVCEVSVTPPGAQSTPELARRIVRSFPHVPQHACVNDEGDRFGDVMDRTSLPHVLEHLVVDLQAHEAAQERGKKACPPDRLAGKKRVAQCAVYVGTTEWIDAKRCRARIEVSFTDDLVALRAFRDAALFLNRALRYTSAHDYSTFDI